MQAAGKPKEMLLTAVKLSGTATEQIADPPAGTNANDVRVSLLF